LLLNSRAKDGYFLYTKIQFSNCEHIPAICSYLPTCPSIDITKCRPANRSGVVCHSNLSVLQKEAVQEMLKHENSP